MKAFALLCLQVLAADPDFPSGKGVELNMRYISGTNQVEITMKADGDHWFGIGFGTQTMSSDVDMIMCSSSTTASDGSNQATCLDMTSNAYNSAPSQDSTDNLTTSVASNPSGSATPSGISDLDWSVFTVTNELRTDPTSYVATLQDRLQYFNGNYYEVPGEITLITNEGADAVNEAITFL